MSVFDSILNWISKGDVLSTFFYVSVKITVNQNNTLEKV